MKVNLRELMDLLGVDQELGPYESRMWSADDDTGTTCSAMASMNAEGTELDAAIDLTYSSPPPDTPAAQQIMFFHIRQDMNKKWVPDVLRLKGETQHNKLYDWEKKAGEFFVAVAARLEQGVIPELDELIERIFKSGEAYGSGTGGGGSRKVTIRPEQLLDPTKRF